MVKEAISLVYHELAKSLKDAGIACRLDEPMSLHTTFRVGGPAALFIEPNSTRQVIEVRRLLKERDTPWFVLGRGSNLLITDEPLDMAVVHLGESFGKIEQVDEVTLYAQAGASLWSLCRRARDLGLGGLEFAYGIPGAVGGGVTMNAGAYGGEMKDVVASVDYLDEAGEIHTASGEELGFGYRRSVFESRDWWILGAAFRLTPGDPKAIGEAMEDIFRRRKEKQPLEYPSAGSTFKRPAAGYAAAHIDECGLKGLTVGGAQVSEKHAGFIINRCDATCEDILKLIGEVRRIVLEKTGVLLEREVKLLGREEALPEQRG